VSSFFPLIMTNAGYQRADNSVCRLLKNTSEARRAKFDEPRRTLQYGEASRAKYNEAYEAFSSLNEMALSSEQRPSFLIL
jgi:hypothetical protein